MTIESPAHLSPAARTYLASPPPPLVGLDATNRDAVTAIRAEAHPIWEAGNDDIAGPWTHRSETIAGVPVVWFGKGESSFDSPDVLVHLHGGAFFMGSPMTNAIIPVQIAQATALPVVSIDYRLAPEHQCPAAIDDVVAVMTELSGSRRIAAMFGESAGGGLALASCVALRDAGRSLPERLGLLSPWVDLTCSGDTYQTLAHVDPDFPDPADPVVFAAAYAGDDPGNPQASPLFADLAGLPPTLIQVGGREILLSDSCRLSEALNAAGVSSTLDIWDGLWHVWHLAMDVPEAAEATAELASFLTNEDLKGED